MHVSVTLTDNYQAKIHMDEFCTIIRNYSKSASFYVNLEYEVVEHNPTNVSKEVRLSLKDIVPTIC